MSAIHLFIHLLYKYIAELTFTTDKLIEIF